MFQVPRVFVNGKCVGGNSETQMLNKSGKLQNLIQECASMPATWGHYQGWMSLLMTYLNQKSLCSDIYNLMMPLFYCISWWFTPQAVPPAKRLHFVIHIFDILVYANEFGYQYLVVGCFVTNLLRVNVIIFCKLFVMWLKISWT